MGLRNIADGKWSFAVRALSAALLVAFVSATPSEAAKKKVSKKEASQKSSTKKAGAGGGYNPPRASIVVDANTGRVLFSDAATATRHPASLTKVMTLYLVFEDLQRGAITLDTPLTVSANAARQAPSKLGFKPGATIRVEDAIKALVTKSANDVAYAIGENLSGSEAAFAQRMTRKARALGMSSTVYVNASGLPDDRQVTSASDLAILGRAIQEHHPKYFPYFSTRSFAFRGQTIGNHNRLLGNVKGVDGIKTGFVRASGFNLLTSAKDGDRSIVAVVLGGRSGASRDAEMRKLVAAYMGRASDGPRTSAVPLVASAVETGPVAIARAPVAIAAAEPVAAVAPRVPTPVATRAVAMASAPAPAPLPVAAPTPATTNAAATTASAPRLPADPIARRIAIAAAMTAPTTNGEQDMRWVVGSQPSASDVQTSRPSGGTTPGSAAPRQVAQAKPVQIQAPVEAGLFPSSPRASAYAEENNSRGSSALAAIAPPRSGWQIQIGATDDPEKAAALLDRAVPTIRKIDSKAQSYTEPVTKGSVTLYRARFAGLSENTAAAACRALKKNSLSCFALKN